MNILNQYSLSPTVDFAEDHHGIFSSAISRVQQATSPALLTYSAPLNQPGPNQYRNCNDASLLWNINNLVAFSLFVSICQLFQD